MGSGIWGKSPNKGAEIFVNTSCAQAGLGWVKRWIFVDSYKANVYNRKNTVHNLWAVVWINIGVTKWLPHGVGRLN